MPTAAVLDDDPESVDSPTSTITDRLDRLEGEVAELRNTFSDLAEIVVGDIKERREAALAVSAPVPEINIPASLVPGGDLTLKAVKAARRPWLLFEILREFGTTVRMYADPRYRVRRATQLMVPLVLMAFAANYLLFNVLFLQIPVVTPVLERLVIILLAMLLYKVISREVTRYRQTVALTALAPRASVQVPAALLNNDPDQAALSRQESP